MTEFLKKHREIIAYLIFGVLTTLVSWVVYALLRIVLDMNDPVQVQIAVVARWVAGVLFAYFMNRKYVFQSRDPKMLLEFLKFVGSRVTTLLSDMFIMWLMVSVLGINDWIATLTSAVIVTVLNYVFSKLLVFRRNGE
jgi:putative flippase GtrA